MKIGKVFTKDELEDKLKNELKEDPKMVEKDIKALKQWIKKQPHLAKTGKQGKKNHLLTAYRHATSDIPASGAAVCTMLHHDSLDSISNSANNDAEVLLVPP